MSISKLITITVLGLLVFTCGDSANGKKNNFSITTNVKNNTVQLGKPIEFAIKNPKNKKIDKVLFFLDDAPVSESYIPKDVTLGAHNLTAKVSYDGNEEETATRITILNDVSPKIFDYKIINQYPHDITSYTQGMEFHNGYLYESTGQYGESKLRKVDYKTGDVIQNVNLEKQYFGEGLTIINNKLYQLTWRENIGFIYDVETLKKTGSFNYGKSKQGWGLCNDGETIFKTDGSNRIWTLNPENLSETGYLEVYTNSGKIDNLNELEYINGKIYANIYQRNGVLIINPKNGAVEGVIDFSPLQKMVKQHPELDVLNGIAYNPETKTIFVTGKDWDQLFEVEVFEKQ